MMETGIRFAIDVGQARIGLARTDPQATMAIPVDTFKAGDDAVTTLATRMADYEPTIIYVGLPLSLTGEHTLSTEHAIDFALDLADVMTCPIHLVDERLTSVSAASQLRSAGHNAQSSRGVVDQAAAIVILEHALDIERKQSAFAGKSVEEYL